MENKENCGAFPRDGSVETRRRKGGGGANLRKSLAWNNAFSTDEGILNPVELSVLSRSRTKCGARNVLTGIQEELLMPIEGRSLRKNLAELHAVEGGLGSRSRFRSGSQCKERVATTLLPEIRMPTFETPLKSLPNQYGSKSMVQTSITNSQKRLAQACSTNSLSKIPKLKGKLAPPKDHAGGFYSNSSSHGLQSATSAHAIQNDIRKDASRKKIAKSSTKPPLSDSGRNLAVHNFEKEGAHNDGSSSTLLAQSLAHAQSHTLDAAACNSKLEIPLNLSVGCHVKPSALRKPSPSLGFFMQGKSSSSHAISSQKNANTQLNTKQSTQSSTKHNTLKQVHHCMTTQGSLSRLGIGSSGSPKNISRKQYPSLSNYIVDADSSLKELDMLPSTYMKESSHNKRSFLQIGDDELESSKSHGFTNDVNSVDKVPGISDVKLVTAEGNKGTENLAFCSHVHNSSDKEHMSAGLKFSDADVKQDCPVLLVERKNKSPGGQNESVTCILSDETPFSLVMQEPICHGLEFEVKDCPTAEVLDKTFKDVDNERFSLIDNNAIAASRIQYENENDTLKENNTDLSMGQSHCTPSTSSDCGRVNTHSKSKKSISAAEENSIKNDNHTSDISKQNAVDLKSLLKTQPFSEEWIATVEAFGEDILRMKSGAVQNSPTEKTLPEPSPWSPVKKTQELDPYTCTKYIKDKFPS